MYPMIRAEGVAIREALASVVPWGMVLVLLAWAAVLDVLIPPVIVLAIVLALLTAIDLRTYTLPNTLVAVLAVGGFVANGYWPTSLAGFVLGVAVFGGIGWAGSKILQKEALGMGDVKFFGAIGTWVGPLGLPLVALVGSLTALAVIVVGRWPRGKKIPFGPFLALGCWVVALYGPDMWRAIAEWTPHAPGI